MSGLTHCQNGHLLDGPNVRWYTDKSGYKCRQCRACQRQFGMNRLARKKAGIWRVTDAPSKAPDPIQRFWSFVEKTDGCWNWTGEKSTRGYGIFPWTDRETGEQKTMAAHRYSYVLAKGEIPHGLKIDHTCHNESDCHLMEKCPHRRCVNPDHLEAVTQGVNVSRGKGCVAANMRKTHCTSGHPYSGDNLIIRHTPKGGIHRLCRACIKLRKHLDYIRKRDRERAATLSRIALNESRLSE